MMFKVLLLSALVVFAVEARPKIRPRVPQLDGRIVGGKDTTIENYPYQISLQYYGSHICGGSIISTNKVLTAAHCTNDFSARELSIRYGSSIKGSGGTVVQVSYIDQHYSYNPSTTDYDVSVLVLGSSISLSNKAQIIGLVPAGSSEGGRAAVVTGWGALYSGGPSPSQLQEVTVHEVSRSQCNSAYGGAITSRMICFGDIGKDSCQGDSGGPLASGSSQVGVVSWGYGCADARYPGVYSHVDNLRGFIESALRNH